MGPRNSLLLTALLTGCAPLPTMNIDEDVDFPTFDELAVVHSLESARGTEEAAYTIGFGSPAVLFAHGAFETGHCVRPPDSSGGGEHFTPDITLSIEGSTIALDDMGDSALGTPDPGEIRPRAMMEDGTHQLQFPDFNSSYPRFLDALERVSNGELSVRWTPGDFDVLLSVQNMQSGEMFVCRAPGDAGGMRVEDPAVLDGFLMEAELIAVQDIARDGRLFSLQSGLRASPTDVAGDWAQGDW